MFKKIENYFRDRYIIKTYKDAYYDINSTDKEYSNIILKYDTKNGLNDKLLTFSILHMACNFTFEARKVIIYAILYLYLNNLKEVNNFSNRKEFLELYKLKLEKTFQEKKLNNLFSKLLEKNVDFLPKKYSNESFDNAMKILQDLINNNQEYVEYYCKSYKTLEYSKKNIELAFNYLLDSVKFDENSPIFNNKEFANNLNGLYKHMLLTYVNDDINDIPNDKLEQMKFKSAREIDFGENQIDITKLISWRNKDQWQYMANAYGNDNDLAKLCLQKSKSS